MIPRLVALGLLLLLSTACDRPLWHVEVDRETLHEKMSLYPNDERVSWWYTGSDGEFRYFVMEKKGTWPDDGYRVPEDDLSFKDGDRFDVDRGDRVRVSRNDFHAEGSLLEQAVTTPDRVRGKLGHLLPDEEDEADLDEEEEDFDSEEEDRDEEY